MTIQAKLPAPIPRAAFLAGPVPRVCRPTRRSIAALATILLAVLAAPSEARPSPERVVAMLRQAVQEYGEGVVGGQVVDQVELATAERILEDVGGDAPSAELDRIRELVAERRPAAEVEEAFGVWFEAHGVGIEPVRPSAPPRPASGLALYARYCGACHGAEGDGKGPLANLVAGTRPADFTDREFMGAETPDEFFQVISYGLPGTAMPEWAPVLTERERWDLVAYLWQLRGRSPSQQQAAACRSCHGGGQAAVDLTEPGALLALSDDELGERIAADPAHAAYADLDADDLVALARALGVAGAGAPAPGERAGADPRHVVAALDLVVEEYRTGVAGGEVVDAVEYGEARLFRGRLASDLDALASSGRIERDGPAMTLAAELGQAVDAKADLARVERLAGELREVLTADLGLADASARSVAEVLARVGDAERAISTPAPVADEARAAAADHLLEAYMAFESVEKRLASRDSGLAASLERRFAELRSGVLAGTASGGAFAALRSELDRAASVLASRPSGYGDFLASLFVILREGIEAILIIGALAAYLTKGGHRRALGWLYGGALAGIVASVVTAFILAAALGGMGLGQEVLEGITMLLASAVLFSVSYWLISKVEARHWQAYIQERMNRALGAGSRLAMAGVSFLAVYREGFETILFYRALFVDAGSGAAVVAGFAVGAVALVGVFVAVDRFSMRIPIKPFFTATGVLLYVLSFRFLGAGIAELQEAGVLPLTPVSWWPRISLLDMAPNLETGVAQMVLIAAALLAALVINVGPRSAVR